MSVNLTDETTDEKIQDLRAAETIDEKVGKILNVDEKQYQTILDTINEGVILQSAAGNILTWNKGAEEIFGISAKDAVGQFGKNWRFIHEDRSECKHTDHPFIKTLQTGTPCKNQIMGLYRKPDDLRWVSISTSPLFRNKEVQPYAVVITLSDITGQNQIETEFRKSDTRFRELAELLPEAVFEADMEMNLLFVNQQAFSMFGYSRQDFEKGLNGLEMLAPEDRKRAKENFAKRIRGEASGFVEYRAVRKDGAFFPVLFHANPIVENGVISGLRGVIIDITNTKIMEQRLIEAQKMEAIGTLAGGIAHDFNNILTPIILHAEMAKDEFPEDDPLQVSIKEIYIASMRARDLVKQILTFARKGAEERTILNASLIVKDTIKFLRSTIPTTIEIKYENESGQDTIFADPIQLNQIVMNLCTNAAYSMRKGGGSLEVILNNRQVSDGEMNGLSSLHPGKYLVIKVKDSGGGIPLKLIDKIFEPYFTTKGPGEGTGLGLSIIHGIVKSYDGTIHVENNTDGGATFYVYLPVIDEDMSADLGKRLEIPGGTERILLVDDEKAGLAAVQKTLESIGYKVSSTMSSVQALGIFRNNPDAFDLVITDMTMPNMTGKELICEMKKIKPDIPTILCTGFSEQIDENEAKEAGISAFILKPIIRIDIANTIRKVLTRHSSDKGGNKK